MSDENTNAAPAAHSIPKARLDAEIAKRKDAETRAASLQTQLTEALAVGASMTQERDNLKTQTEGMTDLQAKIESMQAELDTTKANGAAHRAMLEAGLKDSSVRDFTMHQFKAHQQEAGDEAKDFGAWWEGQVSEPSSILKPFLNAPVAAVEAAPEAAPAPKPAVLTGERGIQAPPSVPAPYAPGAVSGMTKEQFQANKAELLKGISLGSLF